MAAWNDRFAGAGYFFGEDPSDFLVQRRDFLLAGHEALAVADGEGRNGVYMAEQGMRVHSMDVSANAQRKAAALAQKKGVELELMLGDIADWRWQSERYDLVAAIFIQFLSGDLREKVFAGMKETLKPGGVLLLHGYTPKQLDYGTGGPKQIDSFYTESMLRSTFADLEIVEISSYEKTVDEGEGHSGQSALIDFVARRPLA